jgi:hypothetical protein
MLERTRRLRNERHAQQREQVLVNKSVLHRTWAKVWRGALAMQSWVVISIAGRTVFLVPMHPSSQMWYRSDYRGQRCSYFDHYGMALGFETGLLFRRLVAQPTVLLLGNRHSYPLK